MENLRTINVALLGVGTVGGGVYKLIQRQASELPHKINANLEVKKILVRDTSKDRPGIPKEILTDSFEDIINDESIDIVVEVTGGIDPARERIARALQAGKSVVTANKNLIAVHGGELLDEAAKAGRDLRFEAAVAGGIPIIRPFKECLAGNNITEVMGIVNGTTNYILTKMDEDGMDFDEALALATELGYAEADPTADIEGYDAGRKVAIMASLAFNSRVVFSDVNVEGITKITAQDIEFARNFGKVIKLLGITRNSEEGIEASVHPILIDKTHPLAAVRESFNAVFVHGDAVDDAMFYGRGAGEFPTASAVMGDIIEESRNIMMGCTGRIGCSCYKTIPIKPASEVESKFFLRMEVPDRAGVLAGISNIFGEHNISITQVVQTPSVDGIANLVIMTDDVRQKNFDDAIAKLEALDSVNEINSIIRVY